MAGNQAFGAAELTPILYVRNFRESVNYYTRKLLFKFQWAWDKPPTFGCVSLGQVEIFFCLRAQGGPGMWLCIFIEEADAYCERIRKAGAEVIFGPKDQPWGMREFHVRDPNRHVIRFGQGIPAREPKLPIRRVSLKVRVEKRLADLLRDLARHKQFTVGETLEETLLHTFERVPKGGVASPHTDWTLQHIAALKKKHGIDYDCHANYRFVEKSAVKRAKRGAA